MSKLNLTFRGKTYSIDKSLVADAFSDLEATLDTLSNFTPEEPEYPTASEGLAFTLKADNTYEVSGIGTCADLDVVIPAEVDGIAVTSIGYDAFRNCASLTSITIPDSVTYVNQGAFSNCTSLMNVVIPGSVTELDCGAFYGCRGLTSITIPDSVTIIDEGVFMNCEFLTNITFAGTIAQWSAIRLNGGWNSGVPATHVQCSDGQVAL